LSSCRNAERAEDAMMVAAARDLHGPTACLIRRKTFDAAPIPADAPAPASFAKATVGMIL
jgi:hypothetical protein